MYLNTLDDFVHIKIKENNVNKQSIVSFGKRNVLFNHLFFLETVQWKRTFLARDT